METRKIKLPFGELEIEAIFPNSKKHEEIRRKTGMIFDTVFTASVLIGNDEKAGPRYAGTTEKETIAFALKETGKTLALDTSRTGNERIRYIARNLIENLRLDDFHWEESEDPTQ